ncbi:hypothetical protein [Streptomyces profundus]|uniref:hypothetical protein n=1 Tax=Streptomyces profundus TaxID=2867410 RepID=UPI001D16B094|nr:hypothetical protein [Streptomyces sp. MA3_2.13]UED86107.1 hypothetical protein K4G22_19530 [Streptomyces sp. MA3_2.13]
MDDAVDELVAERRRLTHRPPDDEGIPAFAYLEVRPGAAAEDYVHRLRAVLDPTLAIAATADFDAAELPTGGIPDWFARVSGQEPPAAPEFAAAGRERYAAHPGTDGPWELRDWLSRFEPEYGMRGWAWWDITAPAPDRLRIWVDCGTEPWFAHLDLLWLAYTAGAARVTPPEVVESVIWSTEPPAG